MSLDYDTEKVVSSNSPDFQDKNVSYADEEDIKNATASRFGALGPVLAKLFAIGVEARGVERVLESERDPKLVWNNLYMWWSVNCVLTTIPIGVLGQEFFTLTFAHICATIFCFGALGAIFTSLIATLGPLTGLRTMVIVRFNSGYVGGTIYSVLNILTQLGFGTTAVILGGQTLAAVRPGTLSLTGGVVIVCVLSLIPCFIGYHVIHRYERYVWMPVLLVMLFLWGLGGTKGGFNVNAQKQFEDPPGKFLAGDILSYGGIVFGSFTGWAPVAADYNCRLPANTSPTLVFILTFFGLYIPICFVAILGAALMTITNPAYTEAFTTGSTGGLLAQTLSPWHGFGKFLLVLIALSVVANNMVNTYSTGLSLQALGRPFALIPRFVWTTIGFVAYTIAGVVGREHFSEILSNFLSILSYWTAFFMVITLEEHFIFRRKNGPLGGYNLDDWDSPSRLPLGVAGIIAGCCGVAGAVVGMAQVWYIGPIGKLAGNPEFGGDLGFELAGAFAAVAYPPLRWLEIRLTGR